MKKILIAMLCILSLAGCSSVVKERMPVNLDYVLEDAVNDYTVLYRLNDVQFKKEYVLKQKILFNEAEDSFYVDVTLADGVDNYKTFAFSYACALKDYMRDHSINERVSVRIFDKSGNMLCKQSI
jgi:hypothetical protein